MQSSIRFLIVMVLLVLGGCHSTGAPEGILSKPQMVDWMLKIYLMEAKIMAVGVHPDSSYRLFLPYQDSLLRKQSFTDSTLKKSYLYYLEHPDDLEKIYDAIIDSLSLQEQKLRNPRHPG